MSWSYIYSFTHHKNNNITIIFIQSSCKQSNKNYKMGEKLWLQMYKIYMPVMEFHPVHVHSICYTVFRGHTHFLGYVPSPALALFPSLIIITDFSIMSITITHCILISFYICPGQPQAWCLLGCIVSGLIVQGCHI